MRLSWISSGTYMMFELNSECPLECDMILPYIDSLLWQAKCECGRYLVQELHLSSNQQSVDISKVNKSTESSTRTRRVILVKSVHRHNNKTNKFTAWLVHLRALWRDINIF
jgi:hypothetical protein